MAPLVLVQVSCSDSNAAEGAILGAESLFSECDGFSDFKALYSVPWNSIHCEQTGDIMIYGSQRTNRGVGPLETHDLGVNRAPPLCT